MASSGPSRISDGRVVSLTRSHDGGVPRQAFGGKCAGGPAEAAICVIGAPIVEYPCGDLAGAEIRYTVMEWWLMDRRIMEGVGDDGHRTGNGTGNSEGAIRANGVLLRLRIFTDRTLMVAHAFSAIPLPGSDNRPKRWRPRG